ncbi:hypothetical protein PV08_04297 [Exophiala spinifera]|uniref:Uncharacterized protein n=1 Tax=Exophiala spinifera TaxID=91928 RepID=A0A0D1YPJ0_9EURO|nr:uncharacterized protein PV08_04297 [Exophiala spinifera]KIW17106.1 hypothetical protein PV08_04297 [Exophiala spinifera]
MRLLELDTADTPRFVVTSSHDIPFYAILSHTWGAEEEEVTFSDIRRGADDQKQKEGYRKIQFCAEQARRDGFCYFWVDTCCINKSDPIEVSKAINSMFRWYGDATKCYVYLSDVSIHDQDNGSPSQRLWETSFRKSKWFTRGWTLQELLAPKSVEFFSREGERLGDRSGLAQVIHEITSIPLTALYGTPMSHFSSDERLRWASNRHTKEAEDRAYCLLGIFDIFMPLIYGEGDYAFTRLQQEINRRNEGESTGPLWNVPLIRMAEFVGRKDELRRVRQALFETRGRRIVSILGLGGIGKSRFALEFTSHIQSDYPSYSMFWAQATTQLTFDNDLLAIGKKLQIPGIEEKHADIKTLVKQRLSDPSSGKWLLILDNADDELLWGKPSKTEPEASLVDYLPTMAANGAILVTTRTARVASFLSENQVVKLHSLTEEESVKMFLNRLEAPGSADLEVVLALVQALTHMPLAIVQAASFINMARASVRTYLELLKEPEDAVIQLLSEDFGDKSRYPDAKNPIATTWLISFEHIGRHHPLAMKLLSCLVCFHPSSVPSSLLPEDSSKLDIVKAVGILKGYSFVTSRPASTDTKTAFSELYDMHQLVRLAVRSWLRRDDLLSSWNKACVTRLAQIFPPVSNHMNTAVWRAYLPHAQRLCDYDMAERFPERYVLLEAIGSCLFEDGKYKDAVKVHSTVVQWREQTFGNKDQRTLVAYSNLGQALNWQGDWTAAERYLQEAYHVQEETLGEEHADTLNSLGNLALTYYNQGRWKEAEKLQIRSLEIRKRVLGKEHPDTVISMGNLASVYSSQGRWKEDEKLQDQVMKIRKKVLGKEHPVTITSMSNLASTYSSQGRWKESEKLNIQCLEIRKRVLGKEHPDTIMSMSNLASIYNKQGYLKEAEELEVKALEMRKRILGHEHPKTLISIGILVRIYLNQDRWDEAEELGVQVLKARKKVLGDEHPDTLSSIEDLAVVLKRQGRDDEAIRLMAECLQRSLTVLGDLHFAAHRVREILLAWEDAADDTESQGAKSGHRMPGSWVD